MMTRIMWLIGSALMAAVIATVCVALLGGSDTPSVSQAAQPTAGGVKPCPTDAKSTDFGEYALGPQFSGLPATTRGRECDPLTQGAPAASHRNFAFTIYGDCTPQPNQGCAPPLQVQSFPACERNLALYARYPDPDGRPYPYELTSVRGVPAAVFDDGTRVEVYTGDTTVMISGHSRGLVSAAAAALQGRTRDGANVSTSGPLPQPEAGALQGRLAC